MLEVLGRIPPEIILSFSGGRNSVAVLDFISRYNHKIQLLYVDFGDKDRLAYVKQISKGYKIPIDIKQPSRKRREGEYDEVFKITELNNIYSTYSPKLIITCQDLEDVTINYLYNCFKFNPRILQYKSRNVIRPFLKNNDELIKHWLLSKKLDYYEEPKKQYLSQTDLIKKHMLDNVCKINPNIEDNLLKQVEEDFENYMRSRYSK